MLTYAIGDAWLFFVDKDDAHVMAIIDPALPIVRLPQPLHDNDNNMVETYDKDPA